MPNMSWMGAAGSWGLYVDGNRLSASESVFYRKLEQIEAMLKRLLPPDPEAEQETGKP